MKKILRRAAAWLLAALLLAACAGPALAEEPSAYLGRDIEAYVADNIDTTAGMAVTVFRGSGTVYSDLFGFADRENDLPVTADTVFEWGSATKLLVWVSVMQLREQGLLDLDADVRTYLPQGFLGNLRFDEPVTMIHLMNHSAGFEEMIYDLFLKGEVPGLGEALRAHEPEQVFAPGTVTAYSNWGVALAGYIVERITDQPFYEYVQEHIFAPLGMERSALAPDLSDNQWVRERRGLLQCYTADGALIPDCRYAIALYPAGMCTGTVGDFAAFGMALLREDCPLFSDPATREELFTPTSYYGQTGIPRNAHGLWMVPFGAETYGHGGNTAGCSSYLLLDPTGDLGAVVMTNQASETVYNEEMMELIFGAYEPPAERPLPEGAYAFARSVFHGPAKIESAAFMLFGEDDMEEFWVETASNGTALVSMPYGDLMRVPAGKLVLRLGLLLLWILGLLFSAGYLLGWPVGALHRRLRHRAGPPPDGKRGLRRVGAGMQILLALTVGAAAALILGYAPSGAYRWLFGLAGLLALAMLPAAFALVFRRNRGADYGKGSRALNILSVLFLLAAAANVLYWDMFMFWAV